MREVPSTAVINNPDRPASASAHIHNPLKGRRGPPTPTSTTTSTHKRLTHLQPRPGTSVNVTGRKK